MPWRWRNLVSSPGYVVLQSTFQHGPIRMPLFCARAFSLLRSMQPLVTLTPHSININITWNPKCKAFTSAARQGIQETGLEWAGLLDTVPTTLRPSASLTAEIHCDFDSAGFLLLTRQLVPDHSATGETGNHENKVHRMKTHILYHFLIADQFQ